MYFYKNSVAVPFGAAIFFWRKFMKTRVALISIIVENFESVEKLNSVLHDYGEHIIGRMGIPYHKRNISIISVALEAPADIINTLTGKIGRIDGVSAKTAFSNYDFENEVKE